MISQYGLETTLRLFNPRTHATMHGTLVISHKCLPFAHTEITSHEIRNVADHVTLVTRHSLALAFSACNTKKLRDVEPWDEARDGSS